MIFVAHPRNDAAEIGSLLEVLAWVEGKEKRDRRREEGTAGKGRRVESIVWWRRRSDGRRLEIY